MSLCILTSAVCVLAALGSAGPSGPCRMVQSEPGFDPRDVVRQVRAGREMSVAALGATRGASGRSDPGHFPRRRSSRLPELTEFGVELTDNGEFLIDTSSTRVPAPGSQTDAAVGFDGNNFLVVWGDLRGNNYSDITGARVSPDGTLLDPNGFVISQAPYDQSHPAIAFDGTNYLVVWDDYRRGHAFDIYGTRVTPGGAVLDTAGIAISRESKEQFGPAVAFDGANFLVVYEDYRSSNNPDIYGAWVSPAGAVSDEGGVLRLAGNQTGLALARGTGGLLFLVYQGWTGTIGNTTYNTDRIWGKMNPTPGGGIEEMMNDGRVTTNVGPTVVRGVLMLGDRGQKTGDRVELLDASGRKVMDLEPGANDVRTLAPGVYFVKGPETRDRGPAGIRKVVVTR